jgi:hypothetical protein
MVDVGVLEAAHDLHDGVHLADVAEELVPEPFPLGGALDQPGDVDELDGCRDHDAGFGDPAERFEAVIRDGDDANIGIDGAKWVVGRLRLSGSGDGVEQGGLSDVGESDDSSFEHAEVLIRIRSRSYEKMRLRRLRCLRFLL